MATEVRHRRGTTAQHASFVGALGEVTVDTDKKTTVTHDGVTPGGFPALVSADITGKANSGANSDITSLSGLTTPLSVPQGGTSLTTTVAYSIIFSGTTPTGAFQASLGPGTSGQVLTSTGAGALPTWRAPVVDIPRRQTVLSGPVDTNGLAAFGGATGSTTVTASGTLIATASNGITVTGQVDRVGSITNPEWTGLSTNGTMYLFLDIAANGTCTTGSTTLAPNYRWGGADVVTNNQFTFNIQEMVGKVGNGSVATQTYRVYVGEVSVAGNVVTGIIWYALMRRYVSPNVAVPSAGTPAIVQHNIGVNAPHCGKLIPYLVNDTGNLNYLTNDMIPIAGTTDNATNTQTSYVNRLSAGLNSAAYGGIGYSDKGSGARSGITTGSWHFVFVIDPVF